MNDEFDDYVDLVAGTCIAARLRMLNRVVTNIYDDALRPMKIKVSQMNILVATAKLGTARPSELCDLLSLGVSTLSRNVDRMKAKEWLEVVEDQDGRAQPLRLGRPGQELLDRAFPAWTEAQARVQKLLGTKLVRELQSTTSKINSQL